ncbi:MAG: exo-alpha-sialidase, partial [Pirellulaceae bacterium]|nr:exo-alpha-sialidase [Pirellulaceae bacterium]
MKPASFCLVGFPIFMLFYAGLLPVSAQTKPAAVVVQKIWDAAPHNAFTDLVRFQDRWFCVFREGQGHVSADGALRVITSQDGVNWEAAARLTMPDADLRDAKITVTPDQRLMLSGAAAY